MKNLLLFSILFVSCKFAIAQHAHETSTSKHDKEIIQLLRKQQSIKASQEKPTGLRQRVIAQTYRDGTNHDSTTFKYSGMRGSKFDFNAFSYDDIIENTIEPNSFSLLADSISWYLRDTLRYLDYAYYRTDNKTDSLFSIFDFDFYGFDSTKMINTYDGNGVARQSYYFFYDPVTSDTNSLIQYNYDITNTKKLIDTIWTKESGTWLLGSLKKYHYQANGRLDTVTAWSNSSGTLTMTERSIFTYYPDGKLKTRFYTTLYQNGGSISYNDSFGYTPGIEYCTLSQSIITSDMGAGSQVSYGRYERYPGANGNPDSTKYFKKNSLNDSWSLKTIYKYQYNTYDNPEQILVFNSSNTSGVPDQQCKFYYELYEDGLSTKEINKESTFALYPNPCNQELFVSREANNLSGPYKICVLNALGQEVFSEDLQKEQRIAKLETGKLTSGIYVVAIRDENSRVSYKQFVKR